jgi:hypothetical protein
MKVTFSFVVMAVCLTCVASAKAQNYTIDSFIVAGGGGTSTGGVFAVNGTIGQPGVGPASGGVYSLVGGFWGVLQTPGAPILSVTNANGTVTIYWPLPADGFLLEQTAALAAPPAAITWSTVAASSYQTNATRIFITVPMPTGRKFYRLRKP